MDNNIEQRSSEEVQSDEITARSNGPKYHKKFQRSITNRFNSHLFVKSPYPGYEHWQNLSCELRQERLKNYGRTTIGLIMVNTDEEAEAFYERLEEFPLAEPTNAVGNFRSHKLYDMILINTTNYHVIYKFNQSIILEIFPPKTPGPYLPHLKNKDSYQIPDLISNEHETLATLLSDSYSPNNFTLFPNLIYRDLLDLDEEEKTPYGRYIFHQLSKKPGCTMVLVGKYYGYANLYKTLDGDIKSHNTYSIVTARIDNDTVNYRYNEDAKIVFKSIPDQVNGFIQETIPLLPPILTRKFSKIPNLVKHKRSIFDYQNI